MAVMANVTLNGRQMGTLWKSPFRIDVTTALTAGQNTLEIAVANLWVNRLIGDQQFASGCGPQSEWITCTLAAMAVRRQVQPDRTFYIHNLGTMA